MFKFRVAFVVALLVAMTALGPASRAETWPSRTVRIVVPWAAGGITDILARLIAPKLTTTFGQQFIVAERF